MLWTTKHLLKWPKPDKVGVITNSSLKLNSQVIEKGFDNFGAPMHQIERTTPVGFLKREAGALGVINNPKGITKLMMPYRNPYHHVTVFVTNTPAFLLATLKVKGFQEFTQPSGETWQLHIVKLMPSKPLLAELFECMTVPRNVRFNCNKTSLEKCVQLSEVIVLKWKSASNLGIWNFELAWFSPDLFPLFLFDGWGLCDSSTGEPRGPALHISQAFRCLGWERSGSGIRNPWRTISRSGSGRGKRLPPRMTMV